MTTREERHVASPPLGMNLFVVQSVRPDGGDFRDVIWRAIPDVLLMLVLTGLLIALPDLVLWLPRTMIGP